MYYLANFTRVYWHTIVQYYTIGQIDEILEESVPK